jgi:hypothetical protein
MRLKPRALLGGLCALAIGAVAAYVIVDQWRPIQLDPSNPSESAKKALDERAISILRNADKVEVFRIDGRSEKPRLSEAAERIYGYPVKYKGKDQGKEFASELAGVLFHKRTYSMSGLIGCFFPGIVFRPWTGQESVTVVLCLECDQFLVVDHSNKIPFAGSPLRAYLVKLAKQAFPDDPEIQDLHDR